MGQSLVAAAAAGRSRPDTCVLYAPFCGVQRKPKKTGGKRRRRTTQTKPQPQAEEGIHDGTEDVPTAQQKRRRKAWTARALQKVNKFMRERETNTHV